VSPRGLRSMPRGGPMKVGVVFPQTEIGRDPAIIRDYAQTVEAMGYTHILAFDSVVGPNPDRPGGWDSQYDYRHAFHEPLVLFGFLAAVTRRIELATGVLILPQRQTALVAKQAAEVDVLSVAGSVSASAWAGIPSSSRRSARTSRIAGGASRNSSR